MSVGVPSGAETPVGEARVDEISVGETAVAAFPVGGFVVCEVPVTSISLRVMPRGEKVPRRDTG